jgi:hypothetical protein
MCALFNSFTKISLITFYANETDSKLQGIIFYSFTFKQSFVANNLQHLLKYKEQIKCG